MSNPSDPYRSGEPRSPGEPSDGWSPKGREQLLAEVKGRGSKLRRRRQGIVGAFGAVVLLLGVGAVLTQLPDQGSSEEVAVSTGGDATDEVADNEADDQAEDGDGSNEAPSVPAPTITTSLPVPENPSITTITTSLPVSITTAPPLVPVNPSITTTTAPNPCAPLPGPTQSPDIDDLGNPVSTTTTTEPPCPTDVDRTSPPTTAGPPVLDCPEPFPSITTTTIAGCVYDVEELPTPATAPPADVAADAPSDDVVIRPAVTPQALEGSVGQACCPTVEVYAEGPTIVLRNALDEALYLDDAGNVVDERDLTQAPPVDPLLGTPTEALEPLPGFEPFNDPRRQLADGRVLVRGRLDADAESLSTSTFGSNSGNQAPDTLTETFEEPVRLFVYDPDDGSFEAISHYPETRPYSTAIIEGSGPDVVLDVYVVPNDAAVVYTVGFSGAAYDIPYELWIAQIPSR